MGKAQSGGSSSSASEESTERMRRGKRRNGSSGRKQGNDGSSGGGCRGIDTKTAFAGLFKSSNADSPRERDFRVGFSREHPSIAVLEITSRSTYSKNTNKKWSRYAEAKTATYFAGPRKETRGSGNRKVYVGWAEPFPGRRLKDRIEKAAKNAGPQKCQQKRKENMSA